MIRKICLTLAVISTASFSMVSAQQTAKVTASGIGYLQYLPQGYNSNSNKYPLVISLHGIGEKGTSSTDRQRVLADLDKVDNVGLPKYAKAGAKYPFILISPQLKSNIGLWPPDYVISVLNDVKKHLRIDDRRIYLTGLSLGGFGVWRTAGEYPGLFAAIAPICPGGNALKQADEIASHNLPAWGFHGSKDNVVSYSVTTKMINAINSAPKRPNPLAKATIFPGMGHGVWDRAYNETNLLDWMLSHRKGSAPSGGSSDGDSPDKESPDDASSNKAPVVKAGHDRTITLPANALYIQGSANDPDGKITAYTWTKVSGGPASLSGIHQNKLRAYNLKAGTYVFRLTAKDNDGAAKSDNVQIIVRKKSTDNESSGDKNPPSKKNALPTASTGPDVVITLPANTVTIQARASDKDGKIVAYQWLQKYGKPVSISGANSPTLRIVNLKKGKYIFRLRVKDNDGGIHDDLVKVTVNDAAKSNSGNNNGPEKEPSRDNSGNARPVANAGPDVKIRNSGGSVQLIGSGKDADGRIVSYQWRKLAGPGVRMTDAGSAHATLTNLHEGRYYFSLTVKDNKNATHVDKMMVRVSRR